MGSEFDCWGSRPGLKTPRDTVRRTQWTDGYFSAVREDVQIQFGGSFWSFLRGFGKPLLIAEVPSCTNTHLCPSFLFRSTETVRLTENSKCYFTPSTNFARNIFVSLIVLRVALEILPDLYRSSSAVRHVCPNLTGIRISYYIVTLVWIFLKICFSVQRDRQTERERDSSPIDIWRGVANLVCALFTFLLQTCQWSF